MTFSSTVPFTTEKNQTQPLTCSMQEKKIKINRYEWAARATLISAVFFLPLSTTLLYLSLFSSVIFLFLSGDLKQKAMLCMQHPLARICLGFYLVFVIASLYSDGTQNDILVSFTKMAKLLYVPVFIMLMREQKWRWIALSVFVFSMTLCLILGIVKLTINLPILHFKYASPATVFKSYIDTNLMMAFSVFILAQSLFQNIAPKLKYGIIGLMSLMMLYVFWLSEGRAGYFIFMALWILFCIQHLSFKKSLVGLLGLTFVLSAAMFFSPTFQERLYKIPQEIKLYQQGEKYTSVGQRIQYFQNTFQLAAERPWFGWGTGSLKQVYKEHAKQQNVFLTTNPHNEYLNIFFQLGGFGLIYFLGFFGVIFWVSFKLPLFECRIMQGALLAMMLGCLANSWLMDLTPGYLFIMMFGLCAASLPLKLIPLKKGRLNHAPL